MYASKRKTFKRLCLLNILKHVKSFIRETSLQGLKYTIDRNLAIGIRLFFAATFAIIISLAINLSVNIYNRWESTPVIIGKSASITSIQSIPFPAVTICNMNQAKYSKVAKFPNNSLEFAMLNKSCFQDFNYTLYAHLKPGAKNNTFSNFISRTTQNCDEMIIMCKYGSKKYACSELFREILLDEGKCCVFNLLHPYYLYKGDINLLKDFHFPSGHKSVPVDWNPMTGYPKRLPTSYYPRPGLGSGISLGLQIVLNGDINDYYCSSTNGPGFKILLYNPIDQPHIKESGLPVALGSQTNFRIGVNSFEVMPTLRNINRNQRQCIFSDEQEMLFFRYYTRRNCEAECDAFFMLRSCDCIPYHLPLIYANATVCHVRHFECVADAEKRIFDYESNACKEECLPSCHDLFFFPDTFSTPLTGNDFDALNNLFRKYTDEFIRNNLAFVNFYFMEDTFRSNVKSSYTGLTEYMSLTGGIMNLMFGFSIISIAEVAYYMTLCPFFDFIYRRH